MARLRMIFRVSVFLIVGLFLHYVLPQHDIVRVTSTEIIRIDFGGLNRLFYAQADSGNIDNPTRDLRLIYTEKRKTFLLGFVRRDVEEVMVYRNEDTGWIWPPYFKFDSSNLQAEMARAEGDDQWYSITHYGWRIAWASIYPNAVAIRPVDGPDVRIVPWFNIFFFVFLIVAIVTVRAMWNQFRERKVDPLLDSAGDRLDEVQAGVAERRSGLRRWLNTWRKKEDRK